MIEKLLTLVEESSLLMVLPREIVYHCFPVFNDIIAVLLNIAATYLFTKILIMNAWLVEVFKYISYSKFKGLMEVRIGVFIEAFRLILANLEIASSILTEQITPCIRILTSLASKILKRT